MAPPPSRPSTFPKSWRRWEPGTRRIIPPAGKVSSSRPPSISAKSRSIQPSPTNTWWAPRICSSGYSSTSGAAVPIWRAISTFCAHMARHFYVLCLVSFILCCFHYTGKLNGFDKVIYFCNVAAGLLAPIVFLHFCLTFPEPRRWFRSQPWVAILYLPPALLFALWLAVTSGTLQIGISLLELRWMLDRIWQPLLVVPYLLGWLVLSLD